MMKQSLTDLMKTLALKIRIESNPLLKNVDPRAKKYWIIERAMVSTSKKYCYFRIPKSANSTVTRTIAFYDPDVQYDEKDLSVDGEGKIAKKKASSLFDVKVRKLDEFIESYTLLTFVRNPYSRVLSAFLDKIVMDCKISALIRKDVEAFSQKGEVTFEGFIQYLEAGGLFRDPHWCPQRFLLPVAPKSLDFIGRIETLQEDIGRLLALLFGEMPAAELKTCEDGRQNANHLMNQFYDNELKRRVFNLYRVDFDAFNYPM